MPDHDLEPGAAARADDDAAERDRAAERLRDLLRRPDPWTERLRDRVAVVASGSANPTRIAVVVVSAIALGSLAYLVVGAGRASSIDPVQVLPRATPATTGAPLDAPAARPPGSAPARIQAHAAGAVATPGVHELDGGARVSDLIAAAGGTTSDADPDRINLAAPVADGERVYVPRLGEVEAPPVVAGGPPVPSTTAGSPGPAASGPAPTASAPVDLNRADATALDALPGVGPATAAAIIGYREEHGPFTSVEQLQDVTGIGPAKLAQLRDLVRV